MDAIFRSLIPFRFLSAQQQAKLSASMELIEVPKGTRIISGGDISEQAVFVLLEGVVELVDVQTRASIDQIMPGQYFGERAVLFEIPRLFDAIATERVKCVAIESQAFLETVASSATFAVALGNILRVKQGVLRAFKQFKTTLLHGVETNNFDMEALVACYRQLNPSLHRYANNIDVIDFDALSYGLARLPENITRTFALFLTDNLPDIYSSPERYFERVKTVARRRTIYEMMPGKNMILLRDGVSDIVDLMSCICLFLIEAQKIRRRFNTPELYARILNAGANESTALDALPFSPGERRQFKRLWGDEAVRRLYEITLQHEDMRAEISKQLDPFNVRHSERWTLQIADAVQDLIGCDINDLPDEVKVHIISSNTHSVLNCLSPFFSAHAETIMAWGRKHRPEICDLHWDNPTDCLYAVGRDYLKAHPDAREEKRRTEKAAGILQLRETAFTGIEVELVDTRALADHSLDPDISSPGKTPALIINIDYAFGQQAEEILANLILLFGPRLASVNILGKAGAITGERGDLLLATSFIEQEDDLLHSIPNNKLHNASARLKRRCAGSAVHVGPMLTVAGTLLQNKVLLNYYRRIWRCVGLEMEGAYYLRQLLRAKALELMPEDVELRFFYYVSDVPLDTDATLAGPLEINEGIPPLYAITREILSNIFSHNNGEASS